MIFFWGGGGGVYKGALDFRWRTSMARIKGFSINQMNDTPPSAPRGDRPPKEHRFSLRGDVFFWGGGVVLPLSSWIRVPPPASGLPGSESAAFFFRWRRLGSVDLCADNAPGPLFSVFSGRFQKRSHVSRSTSQPLARVPSLKFFNLPLYTLYLFFSFFSFF